MTKPDKFAYWASLLAITLLFVVVVAIGFIRDWVAPRLSISRKAEVFLEDLHAIATQVPRLPDGSVVRQGVLATAWLDDVGVLPTRLQAMAGTLRGAEHQRWLGVVRRGPWSFPFAWEAKDSLLWTELRGVPEAVCGQIERAAGERPDRLAYLNTSGDPPLTIADLPHGWLCREAFSNLTLIMLDPPTEVRRLSADIQTAIKSMSADFKGEAPITGSSAPFQVGQGRKPEPGIVHRDETGMRVTINNVPISICRLALLIGPKAFSMDAFEFPEGATVQHPRTLPAAEEVCSQLQGRLILSRR
jgi:hypothetical protein